MSEKLQVFTELFALGYNPIPVLWDLDTRQVIKYPQHETDITDGKPSIEDVKRWLSNGFKTYNGIALKLYPPYGMFDFDLKNTDKKGIFDEWLQIVSTQCPDILSKICIESTRSGGFHVYIKYHKLDHKIPIARSSKGEEVISVYTGGLLSFCYPSPNYSIIHGDFEQVDLLTDDEYDFLVSTAAFYNENQELKSGQTKVAVIDYPSEYENLCLQFDYKCTDEVFEKMLNEIGLYEVKDSSRFRNKSYVPYLRDGSNAEYSAKAYFRYNVEHEGKTVATSKRLLIFSASMHLFPTWHDSAKAGDSTWSLSPSKIIFYKNKKDWSATIEEINTICDSAGIDIIQQQPITQQPLLNEDRLKFPYDVFPDRIQNYISHQSIQSEYLAGFILGALSTCIGNTLVLEAKDGYFVKPILYLSVVAPAGASKSPALKKAFAPLEEYDEMQYTSYLVKLEEYKQLLAAYKKDKGKEEPEKPPFPQTLIKDSTIEMVIKILSINKLGCCVVADELSGFLKRMNQYKSGDEVQKWLELWSGSPVLLQRITRDENKVQEPYCSVVGGIQPAILETLSKDENEHNGFFHRFLFIYPNTPIKSDWDTATVPQIVKNDYANLFAELLHVRSEIKDVYRLSDDANTLYRDWFNYKNLKYNKATNDHVKGIIAKYQDYCLRLAILLQATHDGMKRTKIVEYVNMERAIRLTEYFLGNMHKAIKLLRPESPIDKLQPPYNTIYNSLPSVFSMKTAIEIAKLQSCKESAIKSFVTRGSKEKNNIFTVLGRNEYEKVY